MHRPNPILLLAAFAMALAVRPAAADEIGGSGFDVPQSQPRRGWERTPFDLSVNLGVAFVDYEVKGVAQHWDDSDLGPPLVLSSDPSDFAERDGDLQFKNEALYGGLRLAGGIGFYECCVMIEPAIAWWAHRPFGNERTSDTRFAKDPTEPQYVNAELEIRTGWDLGFGPQVTWLIRDDIPVVGQFLGGLPLVFFPFVGVAHQEWDVEINNRFGSILNPPDETTDRNFQEDMFMVGFDLDIPLPGGVGPFTHAFTFGFKWTDGNEKHDLLESFTGNEVQRITFKSTEGARYELRYTVYWNDFSSFFTRNIFGPAD